MLHQQDYDWFDVSEAREDLFEYKEILVEGILSDKEVTEIYMAVNESLGSYFYGCFYDQEKETIELLTKPQWPFDLVID